MKAMQNRIRRIIHELGALQKELSKLRQQTAGRGLEQILTPELTAELKASLDAMRRALGVQKRSSVRQRPAAAPLEDDFEAAMKGFQSRAALTNKLSAGSFIERMEAIVERKIPSHR